MKSQPLYMSFNDLGSPRSCVKRRIFSVDVMCVEMRDGKKDMEMHDTKNELCSSLYWRLRRPFPLPFSSDPKLFPAS